MVLRKRALLDDLCPDLCRTWNIHPQFMPHYWKIILRFCDSP